MNQTQLIRETYELAKTNQSNYPLIDVVRRFNLALDEYFSIVTNAFMNGTYVDRNLVGIPKKAIDLVDGEDTYTIPTDNDLVRVMYVTALDNNNLPYPLRTRFERQAPRPFAYLDTQGYFFDYEVYGNEIVLNTPATSNQVGGLTVYYLSTADYFADDGSDVDKVPGINPLHYNFLALYAALKYAIPNRPKIASNLKVQLDEERKRIIGDERPKGGMRRLQARQIDAR